MITSLLIISGITLFAVALFALAQNELRSSSHIAQSYRAQLASRAAFEDAKNLLIRHTANDGYVISSVEVDHLEQDFEGGQYVSRYSFLALPGEGGVQQVPLFSGGIQHTTAGVVDFRELDPDNLEALRDMPHQPKYAVDEGLEIARDVIESLWFDFNEGGRGFLLGGRSRVLSWGISSLLSFQTAASSATHTGSKTYRGFPTSTLLECGVITMNREKKAMPEISIG